MGKARERQRERARESEIESKSEREHWILSILWNRSGPGMSRGAGRDKSAPSYSTSTHYWLRHRNLIITQTMLRRCNQESKKLNQTFPYTVHSECKTWHQLQRFCMRKVSEPVRDTGGHFEDRQSIAARLWGESIWTQSTIAALKTWTRATFHRAEYFTTESHLLTICVTSL